MSDSELREVFESSGQKRPSDLFVVVGAPFALLMAGTALFGGFEFNEPSKFDHMTSKKCLMADGVVAALPRRHRKCQRCG
jgi:hypothetical protein